MGKVKGEVRLFRREWRAAIKGTKFTGRNGRSTWTGKTGKRTSNGSN
jgi:hypothetical protein